MAQRSGRDGARVRNEDDLPQRDRWARLRFAIIAALLAAPPAGELRAALTARAAKPWRHPYTGFEIHFGISMLDRWFYAARSAADPVQALRNQLRRDIGRFPSLSAQAVQALTAQYREHPGWTAQLHHDNLRVRLAAAGVKAPSYPSVRRYLKAQGLTRRRTARRSTEAAIAARNRLEQREVRSYEVEHVLALMHLDFHHGSRQVLTRRGKYVKPLLLGFSSGCAIVYPAQTLQHPYRAGVYALGAALHPLSLQAAPVECGRVGGGGVSHPFGAAGRCGAIDSEPGAQRDSVSLPAGGGHRAALVGLDRASEEAATLDGDAAASRRLRCAHGPEASGTQRREHGDDLYECTHP